MWEIVQKDVPIYCIRFCSFGVRTDEIRKWTIRLYGALAFWNGVRVKNTIQRRTSIYGNLCYSMHVECEFQVLGHFQNTKSTDGDKTSVHPVPGVTALLLCRAHSSVPSVQQNTHYLRDSCSSFKWIINGLRSWSRRLGNTEHPRFWVRLRYTRCLTKVLVWSPVPSFVQLS